MSSLRKFIVMRIMLFLPMLWFLITLVFVLLRVIPGANPIKVMNPQMPDEQVRQISERLGLNRPLWEQYIYFLRDSARFDFGESIRTGISVKNEIRLAYGPTLMLGISSSLVGIPLGIFLGSRAGRHREKPIDHSIRFYTIGDYATPVFLVGILLQVIFSMWIPLLPPLGLISPGGTQEFTHYTEIWIIDTILSGRPDLTLDILIHLILPSITLGMLIAATIARQIRTNMIHQLEQDYIHFARARGIPEHVVAYKYASKNARIPSISLIGLQFALLLSGAVLTETVFSIPGLGRYLYLAIQDKDYPAVQGAMVVFTLVVNLISLISDIIYALLDPRIKF